MPCLQHISYQFYMETTFSFWKKHKILVIMESYVTKSIHHHCVVQLWVMLISHCYIVSLMFVIDANPFTKSSYNLGGRTLSDFHSRNLWDTTFRCLPARTKFKFPPQVVLLRQPLSSFSSPRESVDIQNVEFSAREGWREVGWVSMNRSVPMKKEIWV